MNKNTETVIQQLEKFGVRSEIINGLKQDLNSNKAADNYINKGILRQNQYTQYVTQKETEIEDLKKKVQQLASSHDLVKTGNLDDSTKNALLETIANLEEALVEEGWDEDEVRNLSFVERKTTLNEDKKEENLSSEEIVNKNLNSKEEEDEEMGNRTDTSKFIDNDRFVTEMANLAGGSVAMSIEAMKHIRKYERLYGEKVDDKKIDTYNQVLVEGLNKGKSPEQIAEEHFSYSTREKEVQEEDINKRINSEANRIAAEKIKEAGIEGGRALGRKSSLPSIFDSRRKRQQIKTSQNENSGTKENSNGDNKNPNERTVEYQGKNIPTNKDGIPEYWRARGSKEDRIESASEFHDEVIEKIGDDGMRMGFGE